MQTTENRVICLLLDEDATRALLAVLAMMADPRLTKHLPAEAAVPVLAVPGVLSVSLVRLEVERMRGGAQADDRPARFYVIDDVLHLLVGQVAKTQGDDHQ